MVDVIQEEGNLEVPHLVVNGAAQKSLDEVGDSEAASSMMVVPFVLSLAVLPEGYSPISLD